MLFSTLHTNDAPTTITRLDEMGIEPFMISTCLVRLRAAPDAPRVQLQATGDGSHGRRKTWLLERALDGRPVANDHAPGGCEKCDNTGYKGRMGVHELLKNTDELRGMINRKPPWRI